MIVFPQFSVVLILFAGNIYSQQTRGGMESLVRYIRTEMPKGKGRAQ